MFLKSIQFQIDFGKVIKGEKEKIRKNENDFDIDYLMNNRNIQTLFQQGITKMVVKF